MSRPYQLIDSEPAWAEVEGAIRAAPRLGFDLEADGFHRYPERSALLQISLPDGKVLVVDPLTLPELTSFGDSLADADRHLVLHAGSYDVRALDRDFGFRVRGMLDTAIAAQFCGGKRLGLGNVLRDRLDVDLPKPKRLQRFDWSRRPLPDEALRYAADDVRFLLPLADDLLAELERLGRVEWVREECRRLEVERWDPPPSSQEACLRIKGARDLDDRGRAVLHSLYVFREEHAVRHGRPPHFTLGNKAMVQLAAAPDRDLESTRGIGGRLQREGLDPLRAALERGKQDPPIPWPHTGGRSPWTPEARQRLKRLKGWRRREASRLGLGPGAVWPADHLKRLALRPDADPQSLDEGDPPWVRQWQWDELGESLRRFLAK